MLFKDIQTLENAARTAMAGNDDPLPEPQPLFKATHYGLAIISIIGAAYLFFA